MKSPSKKLIILLCAGAYTVLWLLTATVGIQDIDHAFEQNTREYGQMMKDSPQKPVIRVDYVDVKDPESPSKLGMTHFWKYRSHGLCIAPFLVFDTAGYQNSGLSGIGGKRIVIWLFGWVKAFWYRAYWVS